MKTLKYFMCATLALATVALVGCKKDEETKKGEIEKEDAMPEPEEPTDGSRLIVIQFNGKICDGSSIVLAGAYNEWNIDEPSSMIKFQKYTEEGKELEGKWYYATIPAEQNKDTMAAKPVQLTADGNFSWDYQSGDATAWTIVSGDVNVKAGYSGEADVEWISKVCVAKLADWKNGNYPCKELAIEDFTVNVKCSAFVPKISGDFNGWGEHVEMTLVEGTTDTYTYKLEQQPEGKGFKITNGGWNALEAVLVSDYNEESECYNKQDNYTLVAGVNTIELEVAGTQADVTICE